MSAMALLGIGVPVAVRGRQSPAKNVPDSNLTIRIPAVISKPSRILADDEIKTVIDQKFQLVYKVQQIPDAVRDSFTNFVDWGVEGTLSKPETKAQWEATKRQLPSLRMADPEERMNEDFLEKGVPNRRLVLCAYSDTAALVLYEQGGYVGTERLVILSFGQNPGSWEAVLKDYEMKTLDGIRDALHRRRYTYLAPIPPVQNPI